MPFAVHLTSANLAAMDVSTNIQRTQIIQGDSIKLKPASRHKSGIHLQIGLTFESPKADSANGDPYDVILKNMDVVVMNPPFTKVERGIKKYVDMTSFEGRCGGEVGLWGHFIGLAELFLKEGGMFGAVIPINILRGRESELVRNIIFRNWTPLYVLKPTVNYAFSEWSEYRDVIVIARNIKPMKGQSVKFCLIKEDLSMLPEESPEIISSTIVSKDHLRSDTLDITSVPLEDVNNKFNNMMYFCSGIDFKLSDIVHSFLSKFDGKFELFNKNKLVTGYRPNKDVSKIVYFTRKINDSRTETAFMYFYDETKNSVWAKTHLGSSFKIEKKCLFNSLRTPVGIGKMNISDNMDYISKSPYTELKGVCSATGFKLNVKEWAMLWNNIDKDVRTKQANLVIACRFNPFSPEMAHLSFYSENTLLPSDTFNIILEDDKIKAKAMCAIFNSIIFFSSFFYSKEESTGRYIHIRIYDLLEMCMVPKNEHLKELENVYNKYCNEQFPSINTQFDIDFMQRYSEFWEARDKPSKQLGFFDINNKPIEPSPIRLSYDMDICKALDVSISKDELKSVYNSIISEMIITRHLKRD